MESQTTLASLGFVVENMTHDDIPKVRQFLMQATQNAKIIGGLPTNLTARFADCDIYGIMIWREQKLVGACLIREHSREITIRAGAYVDEGEIHGSLSPLAVILAAIRSSPTYTRQSISLQSFSDLNPTAAAANPQSLMGNPKITFSGW